MPVANVSDIVGRRDLVAEAQGWADIMLKKKELQMAQEKANEARKPKPYNFELADFGTNNESMLAVQEDLNDQAYNYAMANSELLSIDPRTEDCGPECKNAHRVLHNMQSAAKIFNTYGDDLKTRHDALAQLIAEDPNNYDNAENRQKLNDMRMVWKQGMSGENYNFTFGPDGRLVVNTKKRKKTQKIKSDANGVVLDGNGQPIKLYDDGRGGETDDPNKAKKDGQGNPIPIMVDMETGQTTDWDVSQSGFGDWLTSLGFSDSVTNANSSNFKQTNQDYANLIYHDGEGDYDSYKDKSYQALEAYIFGNNGSWDDRTGTGVTNGHSKYLETLVKQEKGEDHIVTKEDLVDMAYNLGMGMEVSSQTGKTTQSTDPVYELESQEFTGYNYEEPIVYGDDKSFDLNAQTPNYKNQTESTYVFEGGAYDTGEQGTIKVGIEVDPSKIAIIHGDDRFNAIDSDIQLSSLGNEVQFEGAQYGVSLFYKGKAISQENFANLSVEEQKKCSYERALYGNLKLPKSEAGKLEELGIKYQLSSDEKTIFIKSIIKANAYDTQVAGRGSGDYNNNLISQAKKSQTSLNMKLQCGLDFNFHENCKDYVPNPGSQTQTNTNSDPLGIL